MRRIQLKLFAAAAQPRPDLASYDLILANSSAGKDSQAMLDELVTLCRALGILARLVVVHADLGRVEWGGARELAEEHAKFYGLRFEVVRRRQGDLLEHVRQRRMWPSSTARYCTSDHKRGQVRRVMTALVDELRAARPELRARPVRILNCMGLRADESAARAKLIAFEHDADASNGKRHVDVWLPIHDWTVRAVWERIAAAGTRPHPAYAAGMPRLSCCFCIFAPRAALIIAGRHNPALLDAYVETEQAIGHTFRVDLPIAAIRDAVRAGEQGTEAGAVQSWSM